MIDALTLALVAFALVALSDIAAHGGIWFSLVALGACFVEVASLPEAPQP